MRKDLLDFLFGPELVHESLTHDLAALFEKAANSETEEMIADKQPLAKALKAMGIEGSVEALPSAAEIEVDDPALYRKIVSTLSEPDNIHKLASMGWVAAPTGPTSMSGEPSVYRIGFLELTPVEPQDSDKPEAVDDILKKAREFATTPLDRDDSNPVEEPSTSKTKNPGVSKATDGKNPDGKPKGAEKRFSESRTRRLFEMTAASAVPPVEAPIGKPAVKRKLKAKPRI